MNKPPFQPGDKVKIDVFGEVTKVHRYCRKHLDPETQCEDDCHIHYTGFVSVLVDGESEPTVFYHKDLSTP